MMIAHKKDFKCPTCDMVFNGYSLLEKHMSSYCIGKLPGRQQKRVEFERTDSSRNSPELGRRPIVNTNGSYKNQSYKSEYDRRSDAGNARSQKTHQNQNRRDRDSREGTPKHITRLRVQNEMLQKQIGEINNRLAQIARNGGGDGRPTPLMSMSRDLRSNNFNFNNFNLMQNLRQRGTFFPPNGSLLDELRALREQYMANGGADQSILTKINNVEAAIVELGRLNRSVSSMRQNVAMPLADRGVQPVLRNEPSVHQSPVRSQHQSPVRSQHQSPARSQQQSAVRSHQSTAGAQSHQSAGAVQSHHSPSRMTTVSSAYFANALENPDILDDMLANLEQENHLLESELNSLQDTNNTQMVLSARDDRMSMEDQAQHREYVYRMTELQRQTELVQQQLRLERLMQELKPTYTEPVNVQVAPIAPKEPEKNLFQMEPYDPQAGFMVFYDFVTGLLAPTQLLRLVVGLYNSAAPLSEPIVFPTVTCQFNVQDGLKAALLGSRQPAPGCSPTENLWLVIEVQTTEGYSGPMITRGWCSVPLFDDQKRLISGRWRVPLRMPPLRPNLALPEQNSVAQLGSADIYLRLVNWRDVVKQNQKLASITEADTYEYHSSIHPKPMHVHIHPVETETWRVPPPLSGADDDGLKHAMDFLPQIPASTEQTDDDWLSNQKQPQGQGQGENPRGRRGEHYLLTDLMGLPPIEEVAPADTSFQTVSGSQWQSWPAVPAVPTPSAAASVPLPPHPSSDRFVTVHIDRVLKGGVGTGKVRLTAYKKRTGQVVLLGGAPLTCTTGAQEGISPVGHVFQREGMSFQVASMDNDIMLVARFYLCSSPSDDDIESEQYLVGWAALNLFRPPATDGITTKDTKQVNTGAVSLRLFRPPVTNVRMLPADTRQFADAQPYGDATIVLEVALNT